MNLKTLFFTIVALLFLTNSLLAQAARGKVREANELYNMEKYNEALNLYRDAEVDDPESTEIHYNIGNTLFKQGKFEEALQEYNKVLSSKDADLHLRSWYNMGNSLYRMNKLPESILSYTRALQVDPDDYESKYNLEFVRNKLKEQLQNQEQNQQDQSREQQQQQQSQQQQDKEEQQEQQEQQGQEQQQQEQYEEREISREEAERILNALENNEKDLQEKRKMKSTGNVRVKKDW